MHTATKNNGYIFSVASGPVVSGSIISEAEYNSILAVMQNRPTAPEGCGYRLREDLEWELYELPPAPEMAVEATESDYIAALTEMGVSL